MVNKMKTYCVVGGSNGLGLAIAKNLENEHNIYILDIVSPSLDIKNSKYIKFDLYKDSISQIEEILFNADGLIITAGIGRVAHFSDLSEKEIDKIININFTNTIKLLQIFYKKMLSCNDCYCMVIGSFAGEISSPLFSVYGATKSGINKICESLNIELEMQGSCNRITNVMPLSFSGSSFNGGDTELSMLDDLAKKSLYCMFNKKYSFIPQENLCDDIFSRYTKDKHEFGISSYQYKIDNNRLSDKVPMKVGYMSGTFDLFHIGHLNIIKKAKEYCDYLIVGVHQDASHKGKETFISLEERKEIVRSIRLVDEVIDSLPEDCDVWHFKKYHILFVGSDYEGSERFARYEEFFKDKNASIVYIPYTQSTSSSKIREVINKKLNNDKDGIDENDRK